MEQENMAGDYEGDDYEEFDVAMTFMPYSNPLLYNQTYLGRGQATAIRMHNGAGLRMHNSLIVSFELGIDFEDEDPCDAWELLLFGGNEHREQSILGHRRLDSAR